MTSRSKAKGDYGEYTAASLLSRLTGFAVKRAGGAGRPDDVGDLVGLPDTVIQVKNWASLTRAINEGLPAAEVQRQNAGVRFGFVMAHQARGKWVIAMTPEQFAELFRAAMLLAEPLTPVSDASTLPDT